VKNQRTSIFSVHVHPDGTRLATGGLGSVLCVRWSNKDGRYLASGSSDRRVLIWEWDRSAEGLSEGSGEHNIENWKPVRRLSGHQSDVVDLAWSRNNTYLASCSLDSLVFIWDGKTFERLHKLNQHLGFVKGVTWDPVGEYLATASDDKTIKIWRTADWTVQAEISKPYAPTIFYPRLSWSPDGSHVATANGAQGAVIFNREEWRTDISLGHDSAIEVVAFNPVIFMIPDSDDADPNSETMSNICAIGSQDHSISICSMKNTHPLFVCQKPFNDSVLDLAWSPDGTKLYACSFDGTVVALQFLNKEFGTRVSEEEHERLLTNYTVTSNSKRTINESAESEYTYSTVKSSVTNEEIHIVKKIKTINDYSNQLEDYLKGKGIKFFDYAQFDNLEKIGCGGFAVVYSAISGGKKYALKSLNNNLEIDEKTFKIFKQEEVDGTPERFVKIYKGCWDPEPCKRPTLNEISEELGRLSKEKLNEVSVKLGRLSEEKSIKFTTNTIE
ncbi:22358_t:CDS:10, partial [Dentiscutata erythropus]